ncbi:MAG: hypothetical protein VXV96_05160 [Bdellovibrionota bacterium]|nr:hypothetical protein [Bdellovibrionota bacterium]
MKKCILVLLKTLFFISPSSFAFNSKNELPKDQPIDLDNQLEGNPSLTSVLENLRKSPFVVVRKNPALTGISLQDLINEGVINLERNGETSSAAPVTITLLERNESAAPVTITLQESRSIYQNNIPFTLTALDNESRSISIRVLSREEVVQFLIEKGVLKPEEIVSEEALIKLLEDNSYGIILGDDEVLFTTNE